MIRYEARQKVFNLNGIKLGGQPGENPPLLIGNMFQKGDVILESRKERKFNRQAGEERIREVEKMSSRTGIPAAIALVANQADEMKNYIDFFLSVTDMPFAIDVWVQKTRLQIARYVAELGIQNRVIYNSVTPWDQDNVAQVAEIKELGIRHIVLQVFDVNDKRPSGRLKSLEEMLKIVEAGNFDSILVDTSAMNLPTLSFSLMANYLIKNKYGLPVGFAPSNGSYMWRKNAVEEERGWFPAIDAGVHAVSAMASDFLLFGPLTGTSRIFPAVAAAASMTEALYFEATGQLPDAGRPLPQLFPDVLEQFEKEEGD